MFSLRICFEPLIQGTALFIVTAILRTASDHLAQLSECANDAIWIDVTQSE
jgi:hypothetical protein